jgi:GNAT superfamily N-acetyltransferase
MSVDPPVRGESSGRAAEMALVPLEARGPDLDEASVVAARAFHHDPFFEFLEPHPVRRARGLALFFRATVRALGPAGEITGARQADGRLMGVAAWVPPGAYPLRGLAQFGELVGALRALILRPASLPVGVRYLTAIERAHPKEPLWYLLLLVVDPLVQRAGLGTRLQAPVLEVADRDGVDCYLETQKPENLAYYRRFGYEVAEELRPVAGGPPLWTMGRQPRAAPA